MNEVTKYVLTLLICHYCRFLLSFFHIVTVEVSWLAEASIAGAKSEFRKQTSSAVDSYLY